MRELSWPRRARLVIGSRADVRGQRALLDRLVAGSGRTGLAGLEEVLEDVLRAPGLEIAPAASTGPVVGARG